MADSGPAFLAAIAVRTTIVFVLVLLGLRFTGKRQAGELNVRDMMLVLILSNSVQNTMTNGNGRLAVALVSSATLLFLGWLLAYLLSRNPHWEGGVVGEPVVIVENGRPIRRMMRAEGVSREELMAAVRKQGMTELTNVKLAILEVDGSISVIPREPGPGE